MRNSATSMIMRATSIGLLSLGLTSTSVKADDDDWMHDVTVLTVASNGAWGAANRPHVSAAIAAAIADCRQRAGGTGSDCGSRQGTIRNGWALAYGCGDRVFAVTGRSLPEARIAAVAQEIDWREVQRLDIPACSLIVAIGPDGNAAHTAASMDVLPIIGGVVTPR